MKILPKVTAKLGENPNHLKPKGLPAMLVSWQLAGPKGALNRSTRKGKAVNIRLPWGYVRRRKAFSRRFGIGGRKLTAEVSGVS